MRLGTLTWNSSRLASLVGIGTLICVLSACGGGGNGSGGGGTGTAQQPTPTPTPTPPPTITPPATSLNCTGYPQANTFSLNGVTQTLTTVCLLLPVEYAAVTPGVSISVNAGDLTAHGTGPSDSYVVYSRIVAQAADEGTANALAKSVVITIAPNGTISASPDQATFPQNLETDFEIFTVGSTNLTLSADAGNLAADHYNATVQITGQAGDVTLDTVQGQVTVNAGASNVNATLAGTAWTGSGMTATVQTGNLTLVHPAGYQADFTAQVSFGNVSIDGMGATTPPAPSPAKLTAGSGAPISLTVGTGNVSVTAAAN